MELSSISCFYCKYYSHLDPDTDICEKHNIETYYHCVCSDFEKE